jgi:hypothetical protein
MFKREHSRLEIYSFLEYYIAKNISLCELYYEIDKDMLYVDSEYDLMIKFEFELEDERYREYPHFQDCLLWGHFKITIDKNKAITAVMQLSEPHKFGGFSVSRSIGRYYLLARIILAPDGFIRS